MSQTKPVESNRAGPGTPRSRLTAALKQLRIARDQVTGENEELDGRIEAAIVETEAARELVE